MKTTQPRISQLLSLLGLLALVNMGWGQTTPNYISKVTVTGPGGVSYATYTNGLSSGTQANVSAQTAAGANGVNTENYGTWQAQLLWEDTTATPPTYSSTFDGGATVTTNWAIATPIPEITPETADLQVYGGPTGSVARTLAGVSNPLAHVYLNDDYTAAGVLSNPYTGPDRYTSNSVIYINEFVSGTLLTTDQESALSNAAYTYYHGSPAGSATGSAFTTPVYDLAANFPTNALTAQQTVTFDVQPGSLNPLYTFKQSNLGASFAQGANGAQTTIYVHPAASVSLASWSSNGVVGPFSTSITSPAPTPYIHFDWTQWTVAIQASNLYPANFTWLEIDYTPENGSTTSYYVYSNQYVANSDMDMSGGHTSTVLYTGSTAPNLSSLNETIPGTPTFTPVSISPSAPNVPSSTITSSNSNPQNITFVVNLADLKTALGGSPMTSTIAFQVHSAMPFPYSSSNASGVWTSTGGTSWGSQDFTTISNAPTYFLNSQTVHSGVVTSPQ